MELRHLLLLILAGLGWSSAQKETRTSPVFTASNTQYSDSAPGPAESSHVLYDTLSSNQNTAKQLPTDSAALNSFGFSTGPNNGGYSNTYSAPGGGAPAYIPPPNRPNQGYPDSGQVPATLRPFQPDGSYSKPEQSYAYFYQHYPGQQSYGGAQPGNSGLWAGDLGGDSDLFGGLGDLGSLGLGGAGIAAKGLGLGALALAAVAKGVLALKPLLLIGAILVLLLPLLILFLPIPIISLSPAPPNNGRTSSPSNSLTSALTALSDKVLNSEECLERLLCKLPVVLPQKYQDRARSLWTDYGAVFLTQPRVTRGLAAYFQSTETKQKRALSCNHKFKCTNSFL